MCDLLLLLCCYRIARWCIIVAVCLCHVLAPARYFVGQYHAGEIDGKSPQHVCAKQSRGARCVYLGYLIGQRSVLLDPSVLTPLLFLVLVTRVFACFFASQIVHRLDGMDPARTTIGDLKEALVQ